MRPSPGPEKKSTNRTLNMEMGLRSESFVEKTICRMNNAICRPIAIRTHPRAVSR
jgi:hypothetical protein